MDKFSVTIASRKTQSFAMTCTFGCLWSDTAVVRFSMTGKKRNSYCTSTKTFVVDVVGHAERQCMSERMAYGKKINSQRFGACGWMRAGTEHAQKTQSSLQHEI